jgi:hypothetical protein
MLAIGAPAFNVGAACGGPNADLQATVQLPIRLRRLSN